MAAAVTPNRHFSSYIDLCTDAPRSIPNVDLHTLAHPLSPSSNRPPHNDGAASAGGGSHGNAKIGYHGRYQNAKDAELSHHCDHRVLTDHPVCTSTSPPTLLSLSSSSLAGAAIGIGGGSGSYGGQNISPTTPVFWPIGSDNADLTARPSASSIARPRRTRPDDLASRTAAAAAAGAGALFTSSSTWSISNTDRAGAAAARHNNTATNHDHAATISTPSAAVVTTVVLVALLAAAIATEDSACARRTPSPLDRPRRLAVGIAHDTLCPLAHLHARGDGCARLAEFGLAVPRRATCVPDAGLRTKRCDSACGSPVSTITATATSTTIGVDKSGALRDVDGCSDNDGHNESESSMWTVRSVSSDCEGYLRGGFPAYTPPELREQGECEDAE